MQFIDNPWFYAAAIPAVILTGVSKGGFAGAFSGLSDQFYLFGQSCIFMTGIKLLYDGLRNLGVF